MYLIALTKKSLVSLVAHLSTYLCIRAISHSSLSQKKAQVKVQAIAKWTSSIY